MNTSPLTHMQQLTSTTQVTDQPDLAQIHSLILGVKDSLDSHKQTVEDQINKLSASLNSNINNKIENLGDSIKKYIKDSIDDIQLYVDTEVGRLTSQINDVVGKVRILEEKQTPQYDPEVSFIMLRVPQSQGEDIQEVAEKIIHEGLRLAGVPVVRAMRLRQRDPRDGHWNARPGQRPSTPLVKVELPDLETKKRVLRAKLQLANTPEFSNVWIRSSKPHVERLIELNFKTILDMIPGGNTMTVTNSGRITKKNSD
jgi:gas vesicle protein